MGSGKTTVGRLLGERWGVPVRDTDEDVERVAGKTVGEIFVDDGEARFRELEREAVATALGEDGSSPEAQHALVLAESTRLLLSGHPVVFLQVGLADAVRRVGLGESRPLLAQAVGGVRARIKALLDERAPIYASVATHVVQTDGRTPGEVADEIVGMIDP
jgi:shikimate kinase